MIPTSMSLNEAISILEANGLGAEITNKKLRKMLDDAGFSDVHLIKGDGYLYVDADNGQHADWLYALDSTALYRNSFGQASPETWFSEIVSMLRQGRKEFMDSHADEEVEPEAPTGPTKLRLVRRDESVNEDFGIGVGGMTGADQGIPMGGDCKAVVAKRMDGGKPRCRFRDLWKKRKKKKVNNE